MAIKSFLLLAVVSFANSAKLINSGSTLARGPDPIDFPSETTYEKSVKQRQIGFFPHFGYSAQFCPPPQIINLHPIVLFSPQTKQQESCPPTVPPSPATRPDTDSPGLGMRFGENDADSNTTKMGKPSKCVWSIVACCAPGSKNIKYTCFELLGCPGAFWDKNPCEAKVVQAAANTALKYYMDNPEDSPSDTSSNDY